MNLAFLFVVSSWLVSHTEALKVDNGGKDH